MPRTAMPTARHATALSRGFAVDPSYRDRDFPGLGMRVNRPAGFVVAWDDNKGQTHTTQTVPTYEAALTLLEEIAEADEKQERGRAHKQNPQRRNLRVIESRT